ncbi:IscS subfamily cysteine desulfurase [Pinibacter soli]|uniref:cysteine desulfurase n=1 Tax=Pinibacter soli TaxID=3044211 RepID=A0ABT6RIU6_9BACT|nr:IscS subfamily cysteine desulfurase [Pinibacter soli]MDI3322381.1 IscS subfamily cysteine desulfurase [Pinibacter soli]
MPKLPIYLDYSATTPCDPRVVEAMLPYFTENFGNAASRNHVFGWAAEGAVEVAREQLAAFIGAETQEIIFTSGATEADNLAIKGIFDLYASKGNHIITTATEHKAVLDTCKHIEKMGGEVSYLPVKADGRIDISELEAAIKPTTILIAVIYANNEIGNLQPVREISAVARKHNVIFFCDAVQAMGKVPVNVNEDGIDLMAFTAHKMYGPKGIGALYVRRKNPRVKVAPQMDGGGHERGMRSGTLNVPGIVGFGKAAEIAAKEMEPDAERIAKLRNRLEQSLLKLDGTFVNGSIEYRLPHISNVSFQGLRSDELLAGFNKEVAVSSGSACTSASLEPSYVLKALGISDELSRSCIRFSLGKFTTEEEIDYVIEKVVLTVAKLRKEKTVQTIV